MARLANESKMGFYPTSVKTIKKVIDKTITFPENKTIFSLDCCCGEGEAIEMIGAEYGCKTFAVELDKHRSQVAEKRDITKVLNADALQGVRKSNHWVGLNFLNPPYDTDSSNKRMELNFIERWGLATAIGGVLILVINPSSADAEMAKKLQIQGYNPLASFYDEDNEDYQKYQQFFIILKKQLPNFRASMSKFESAFENPISINSEIDFEKTTIRTGAVPSMFKEINVPRWKIEEMLEESTVNDSFFKKLKYVDNITSSIEHPNDGQAAILISSGVLNKAITLKNGDKVLFKGQSTKYIRNIEQANSYGEVTQVKASEAYKTVLYGLDLTHAEFFKYE